MPVEARRGLWPRPLWQYSETFLGIVPTPNSQPDATYSHTTFPAATIETVRRYFEPWDFKTPQKFWEAAVGKRWLAKYRERESGYQEIKVGSLTYELPVCYE